jgi:hypothetical protein
MRKVVALVTLVCLVGCATAYQETGWTGGYEEAHLKGDVWRVSFDGNGYTNRETAQTYWLYRSAKLTLAQGYDGFEIVSSFEFMSGAAPSDSNAYVPTFYYDGNLYHSLGYIKGPSMSADVRLLRKPFNPKPPIIFDARTLKSALEPFATSGKKCDSGNVCPHDQIYLHSGDE